MYFINNYYDWKKGNNTINQRLISKTDASHWSFSSDLLNSWLVLFFWNIFKLCCTNAEKSFRSFCSVEKCANLHLLLDHLYHNQNHNQTWHRESFGWQKCFRRIQLIFFWFSFFFLCSICNAFLYCLYCMSIL